MLADPTLVFDPTCDAARPGQPSACCGGTVDVDGACAICELAAALPAPYRCSTCNTRVLNITPGTLLLECVRCGARWSGLDGTVGTTLFNGIPANSWDPTRAPARYTAYLSVYAGHQTPQATGDTAPGIDRDPAADTWDGIS